MVSPVLLNIALHGMEQAAGVRYLPEGWIRVDSPVLIRYGDDFVALCHTRQDALGIKARLARWLAPRGLSFNEQKTRVVTLSEGFDFLGFNVRRYGQKPLIRPSKAAVRRIRQRLHDELVSLRGHNARAVIRRLNPIIRGWAAYYRTQVSSKTFKALDQYLWALTYRWALLSHRNKSRPWVFARYFGKFNRSRQDRWVFGDLKTGAYLHRFGWTGIVRHQIVRYRASPDDPDLTEYWVWRRRKAPLPINTTTLRQYAAQNGRCHICKGLLHADNDRPQLPKDWEQWLAANRAAITTITTPDATSTDDPQHRLIHADCINRNGATPDRPQANRTSPSRMR